MSSLIVLLPAPVAASANFEFLLTQDGQSTERQGTAQASVLPMPTGAGAQVVAVVPSTALAWFRVDLPKGISAGSPRLREILEGLLEDRVLDDAGALHFALQPGARPGSPVWVAACDRAWLRSAVQALEAAQRPVARIVPEFAPQADAALYAMGETERAVLVATDSQGVITLPLSAHALDLLPDLSGDTPCYAEPAVAAAAEQVLNRPCTLHHAQDRWLHAAASAWDLAQFDLASSSRARAFKKLAGGWSDLLSAPRWRPARWAVLGLLLVNLIGLNAWAWKERSVLDDKREAIRGTLSQTFPQVKLIVDAPVQMEREVAALRLATGTTSGRDLEAMLGVLSTAAVAQRPLGAIEFNGTELRLKGLGYTEEQVSQLAAQLKGQGYTAAMQGDTLVVNQDTTR